MKILSVGPHVGSIQSDVDGKIPDNAYAEFGCVRSQSLPLAGKFELQVLCRHDRLSKAVSCGIECRRVATGKCSRPRIPCNSLIFVFARHEEGKIGQPCRTLFTKVFELVLFVSAGTDEEARRRGFQQSILPLDYSAEVDCVFGKLGLTAKVSRFEDCL